MRERLIIQGVAYNCWGSSWLANFVMVACRVSSKVFSSLRYSSLAENMPVPGLTSPGSVPVVV